MTSHEAISGAAGASIASGGLGFFAYLQQWVTLQNWSNLMSAISMAAGVGFLIYQRITATRRKEHQEDIQGESKEISLLMDRNFALLQEIVKLNKQIVEVSSSQPHGCVVSRELVRQMHEQGKSVVLKDDNKCPDKNEDSKTN